VRHEKERELTGIVLTIILSMNKKIKHEGQTDNNPDVCKDCGSLLLSKMEERNEGYFEIVSYCEGCGNTYI
jgi:uncharacterized protein with PIN domain